MAELATLARPYAKAVFELAKRDMALPQWSTMLDTLGSASTHPKVAQLLESPDVDESSKAYKLAELCGTDVNDRARKFLQVLAANKRLDLIGEIAEQFEALRAAEEQSLDVEVVSAFELTDAQAERIKTALAGRYQKSVTLTSRVDTTLIGGAVIRAGDTVIDGSVRGKLDKLAESLQRV